MIADGNMTAEDFLEENHKLRVQQQVAREEEEDRADQFEVEELNVLREVSVRFETGCVGTINTPSVKKWRLLWLKNSFLNVIRPRRDLQARTSCEHSEISLNLNAY